MPTLSATISSAPVTTPGNVVDANGYLVVNTVANIQTVIQGPRLGDRTVITDAVACVFMQPIVGGGTLFCPVMWDGKQWVAG